MLAARTGDGRGGAYRFPAPATPQDPWPVGRWRPVLPSFGNDPAAWIKDVRPFLIRDPARYATKGPYALTSKQYAREFNEVKAIGSLASTKRTADQTDQARFWAEGPQPWTRAARQLAIDRGLPTIETARMFAMLYTTGADALISVWSDKARWLFWRPITAIRDAGSDGNADTAADATWLPLINTPVYPDQPSGLSAVSAAMAESLEAVFGRRTRFSVTSLSSNTTRSYRASRRRSTRWSTPASTPGSTSGKPTRTAQRSASMWLATPWSATSSATDRAVARAAPSGRPATSRRAVSQTVRRVVSVEVTSLHL